MRRSDSIDRQVLRHLMQEVGLALLQCQHFENLMVVLLESLITLGAIDSQGRTPDEWALHLNDRTAGQLARQIQRDVDVEGLVEALTDAVGARNDLAHRFFLDWMPYAVDPTSVQAALDELDRITRAIDVAVSLLEPHMVGLATCITGVDLQAVSVEVRASLDSA